MKSEVQFILSMVIFGTIGVFVRYIELSSSETALLSSSIGCLFLMFVFFLMKGSIPWKRVKANAAILLFSGIALGGNWIFLYKSYEYTTITNATLGYYFAPVFVMLLSPLILKENLPAKKVVCIGAAVLGLILIVGNGFSAAGTGDVIGISFGLTAAAFYAALMLLNKFIRGLAKLEITIIQLGVTALLLLPYVLFTEGVSILEVSPSSIPFILILGIVNTGIGFWLFFSGMQKLKGQSIAMLSYVDPFVAILISWLILQEQMTIVQMLGGVLLLGSTFISENQSIQFTKRFMNASAK
ncbi:DMT family transporter [Planomicrobium sp. CPCC 101110]|uniref:DMT family transporter n=1 Tax=Planomicrobium sp. CPCC 101110 TaxID=2599619 RepID=UPI0011B5FC80|nr:EamA family transporter [Planomicrobium sp. CPCC 101110]TWT27217.1 EamA family transporter [Planomicrobium sp. CPCC 101110]